MTNSYTWKKCQAREMEGGQAKDSKECKSKKKPTIRGIGDRKETLENGEPYNVEDKFDQLCVNENIVCQLEMDRKTDKIVACSMKTLCMDISQNNMGLNLYLKGSRYVLFKRLLCLLCFGDEPAKIDIDCKEALRLFLHYGCYEYAQMVFVKCLNNGTDLDLAVLDMPKSDPIQPILQKLREQLHMSEYQFISSGQKQRLFEELLVALKLQDETTEPSNMDDFQQYSNPNLSAFLPNFGKLYHTEFGRLELSREDARKFLLASPLQSVWASLPQGAMSKDVKYPVCVQLRVDRYLQATGGSNSDKDYKLAVATVYSVILDAVMEECVLLKIAPDRSVEEGTFVNILHRAQDSMQWFRVQEQQNWVLGDKRLLFYRWKQDCYVLVNFACHMIFVENKEAGTCVLLHESPPGDQPLQRVQTEQDENYDKATRRAVLGDNTERVDEHRLHLQAQEVAASKPSGKNLHNMINFKNYMLLNKPDRCYLHGIDKLYDDLLCKKSGQKSNSQLIGQNLQQLNNVEQSDDCEKQVVEFLEPDIVKLTSPDKPEGYEHLEVMPSLKLLLVQYQGTQQLQDVFKTFVFREEERPSLFGDEFITQILEAGGEADALQTIDLLEDLVEAELREHAVTGGDAGMSSFLSLFYAVLRSRMEELQRERDRERGGEGGEHRSRHKVSSAKSQVHLDRIHEHIELTKVKLASQKKDQKGLDGKDWKKSKPQANKEQRIVNKDVSEQQEISALKRLNLVKSMNHVAQNITNVEQASRCMIRVSTLIVSIIQDSSKQLGSSQKQS